MAARKTTREMVPLAAEWWREGWTAQEIADEITERFQLSEPLHKQAVQNMAMKNRNDFPKRDRAMVNRMISDTVRENIRTGKTKPNFSKKREVPGIDFEW